MALKGLNGFLHFNMKAFLEGKKLVVASCDPWYSGGDSKEVIGTKVNCLIQRDETVYPSSKDGVRISNKYQTLTFKVHKVGLNFPEDAPVMPAGNIIAKVWGDYRNNLSIEADDMKVIQAQSKAPQGI